MKTGMWAAGAVALLGVALVTWTALMAPNAMAPDGRAGWLLPAGYFLALGGAAAMVVIWMRGRSR